MADEKNVPEVVEQAGVPAAVPVSKGGYLVPNSLDGQWRLATIFHKSGMAPKGLDGVAALFTAIQLGSEVGLAPMQAIQNIAVVNGRPTIWGDAQLALVRAHSDFDFIKERVTGAGPNMVATCEVKRKSDMVSIEQSFSVEDAKLAGLWSKQGPWKNYPRRMLQMRARGFALRDAFPDVLKGLSVTQEEAIDMVQNDVGSFVDPEAQTVNDAIKEVKKPNQVPVNVDTQTGEVVQEAAIDESEGPWDRVNWINLRSKGFAAFVKDNATTFEFQPEAIQDAVRYKWHQLYKGEPFYGEEPVDPEPVEVAEEEVVGVPEKVVDPLPPAVQEKDVAPDAPRDPPDRAPTDTVICPQEEGEVVVKVGICETACNMRKGCPAFTD